MKQILLVLFFFCVAVAAENSGDINLYGHGFKVPEDFTAEQYQEIANKYSIFTIEKRHAYETYGGNPSSEQATIETAKKIKTINPDAKVLAYWNSILNYKLYESQQVIENNPHWISGLYTLGSGLEVEMYDLNNAELQQWWVDSLASLIIRGELDGVFLDAVSKVPEDMHESLLTMIVQLRNKVGEEKVVLYNGFRVQNPSSVLGGELFLEATSGVFVEAFFNASVDTKEDGALLLDMLISAEEQGKYIVSHGTPNEFWGTSESDPAFHLAAYLLVYGPQSYFHYSWGYSAEDGMFSHYPEFEMTVGQPLGKAERNGWIYRREFENCVVTVDLERRTATIDERESSMRKGSVVSARRWQVFNDILSISSAAKSYTDITISDLKGRLIYSLNSEIGELNISLTDLTPGVYIATVRSSGMKQYRFPFLCE